MSAIMIGLAANINQQTLPKTTSTGSRTMDTPFDLLLYVDVGCAMLSHHHLIGHFNRENPRIFRNLILEMPSSQPGDE